MDGPASEKSALKQTILHKDKKTLSNSVKQ